MLNILLVENDQVDVMYVQRAFKIGHIINPLYVASDGSEALDMLRGKGDAHPLPAGNRLVLLDLHMPKMDGIEFLKALRADSCLKPTPVVVLTTSTEDQDRVNAYDLNVAGYLLKPVTFNTFIEAMTTLNNYWALCELP